MSTIAQPEAHLSPIDMSGALVARRVVATVAAVGLVMGAGAGILIATSDHLVHPVAYGLEVALIVEASALAALYWAANRPSRRIAVALLVYAGVAAGISLQGTSSPLLHSIGVLFDAPLFLLGFYLVFIFPEGRLAGALEKVLLGATAWVLLISFLPWFLFSPVVSGGAPLAGCNARCPSNALMIANRPSLAEGFGKTEEYLAVLVAAAIVAGLCYRLERASRPRVRALLPVYVPALLLAIPFAVFHAANAGLITLDAGTADRIGWLVTAGRTTLTFGFLLAILQTMLFAGLALRTIMAQLEREEDAVRVRDLVADALDDPRLELAVEVDARTHVFVDSRGDPIDPSSAAPGRSATALRRRGETVGYLLHDPALETDPELLQSAGKVILLSLESGRLEAELRSTTDELQTSRRRIVTIGEAERRKLERDLHDGAQQRLLAIQLKLALAREHAEGDELAEQLELIGSDAAAAAKELRELAHGIYPAVLLERGVAEALRSVAITAAIPVTVTDEGIGRCSPATEAAVYFCALEAIQNAAKHAGPGAHVTVTLARRPGEVVFAVADDGVGLADGAAADGTGVAGMHDRMGALGGTLEIATAPGRGTTVRGTIPE